MSKKASYCNRVRLLASLGLFPFACTKVHSCESMPISLS